MQYVYTIVYVEILANFTMHAPTLIGKNFIRLILVLYVNNDCIEHIYYHHIMWDHYNYLHALVKIYSTNLNLLQYKGS